MREKQIAERDFHLCDSGMLKKRQEKIKSGKIKDFETGVQKWKNIRESSKSPASIAKSNEFISIS